MAALMPMANAAVHDKTDGFILASLIVRLWVAVEAKPAMLWRSRQIGVAP
jgi:hypothetical protein